MEKTKTATKDVIVRRLFDAPVERVWKALTEAEQIMRWWGPSYFSSPSCKMDFREGGTSLFCMRSPDGVDMYSTWTYRKIVPMQRIEFITNLADKNGNRIEPAAIGAPDDFPTDVQSVVTLRSVGDKTEMMITQRAFPDSQTFEWAVMGLTQSLDKLAGSLKK